MLWILFKLFLALILLCGIIVGIFGVIGLIILGIGIIVDAR